MSFKLVGIFLLALLTVAASVPVVPASNPTDVEIPSPYQFGFEFGDGLGMAQHRQESSDGNGIVQGSYGYVDPYGIYRDVVYKADADGYKVIVRSNEPGLSNTNSADATFIVESPPPGAVAQQQNIPVVTLKTAIEP